MCGIAAVFGEDGEDSLKQMLRVTAHRGEDVTRLRAFENLGSLGINRLSIMDVERGDQPLNCEDGSVHVVCNGEIYNHQSIADELSAEHTLATASDAEVLPHLYEDHGADCVNFLDGMFAFVLLDRRRGTFLAARDPLGIKPLYYARTARAWYLASEAKALLQTDADPSAVRALPPGFRLTPERGPEPYYHLPTHRSVPSPEVLRALLDHAVGKRMMADPDIGVGTFLSGGLDSSIITALAAQRRPDLTAITVGVEGSPDVEAARVVADHLGVRHVVRSFDIDELRERLSEAIWHVESYNPSMVTGAVVTLMAAQAARDAGLKVVLCGEGADEILAGYLALRDLPFPELHDKAWTLMRNLHKTELQRLDRMSMAVSLEARVPFLDRDVVEYALNLPPSAKIRELDDGKRIEKYILRQAFDDLLPKSIVWREKCPFDQGSGARGVIRAMEAEIDDGELAQAQLDDPEAGIVNKEMLHYHRIWRRHFGELGGGTGYEQFGDYPVMMERIATRTALSGS